MAKPELGTKRVCPETGRKFYDLNRDPVLSPYTGKSYPRSFFDDSAVAAVMEKEEEEEVAELDAETPDVEVVSLEEADKETAEGEGDDLPDIDAGDDEVEIDDDDDDTFLPDDDDDDEDDMSDLIGGVNEDDDEV